MTLKIILDTKHPEWHSEPQPEWNSATKEWKVPATAPLPSTPPETEVLGCIAMDMSRLSEYSVSYDHEARHRCCYMTIENVTPEEQARIDNIKGLDVTVQ